MLHDLDRRRATTGPSRGRRLAIASFVSCALLAVGLTALAIEARGHRYSHFLRGSDGSVTAIDRQGRTLWRHEDTNPFYLPVRLVDGTTRIARIAHRNDDRELDHLLDLEFLDPQTGESVDRIRLLGLGADYFPGFSRTYGPILSAVDLDGDGGDEIVVVFNHTPYWPTFAELVEPAMRRVRTVLIASGHHMFRAAQDLDGDGRAELLFAGINNRLGWRTGVAAVRVEPWIGERWPPIDSTPRRPARSTGSNAWTCGPACSGTRSDPAGSCATGARA